jgi:hypothetical protein
MTKHTTQQRKQIRHQRRRHVRRHVIHKPRQLPVSPELHCECLGTFLIEHTG